MRKLVLGAMLLGGCAGIPPADRADVIYTGGTIVTVSDAQPAAEALAVKDGVILAVGRSPEIERTHSGPSTRVVNLAGRTLVPGFIDTYGQCTSSLAQQAYARAGFTTAQAAGVSVADLQRMYAADANLIDVVAFPPATELSLVLQDHPAGTWGTYQRRLKLGGVVTTAGPGVAATAEEVAGTMRMVYALGIPLLVEARDEDAADLVLRAQAAIVAANAAPTRTTILLLGAGARADQFALYGRHHLRPSLSTLHTFDAPDAASASSRTPAGAVSPLKAAFAMGLEPTNHGREPGSPPNPMMLLWTAVTRLSRTGEAVGPDQRVTPLEGLKAMTINAARQYGEDGLKGSLEPGKLADLVILDQNPLTINPLAIKDIQVLETIKEGATIHRVP